MHYKETVLSHKFIFFIVQIFLSACWGSDNLLSTGAIMVSKVPNTPERVQALKEIDNHPTIKKWAKCFEGELWFPSLPPHHQTECSVMLLGEIIQNIYVSHRVRIIIQFMYVFTKLQSQMYFIPWVTVGKKPWKPLY